MSDNSRSGHLIVARFIALTLLCILLGARPGGSEVVAASANTSEIATTSTREKPFSVWPAQPRDTETRLIAPAYTPELLRALRATPAPAKTKFNFAVTYGRLKDSYPHRFIKKVRDLPPYGGDEKKVPAIYVSRGSTDLLTLARQPEAQNYLSCEDRTCTLTAPLLVAEGAALTIDRVRLNLIRDAGALIASHGTLHISNSHVEAILPKGFKFTKKYREFRPFILGLENSDTRLIGSGFVNLGHASGSSYGISFSARKGEREPTGIVAGNVFDGLYYGFYSHHAKNVPIIGNLYRNNIVYGVDPHDYSHDLWIIGNRAYGTKKKHGIVISRGVNRTWIMNNHSWNNNGTGVMLDRHSSQNVIAYNHVWGNGNDGVAIFESSDNLVQANTAIGNGKAGIRIRNAVQVRVRENLLSSNPYAMQLYTGVPNGFVRKAEDSYEQEVEAILIGNHATGSIHADLSVKGCVKRMVMTDHGGTQPGFDAPRITIAGAKEWKTLLRRINGTTRGDLDVRYHNCPPPDPVPPTREEIAANMAAVKAQIEADRAAKAGKKPPTMDRVTVSVPAPTPRPLRQ